MKVPKILEMRKIEENNRGKILHKYRLQNKLLKTLSIKTYL